MSDQGQTVGRVLPDIAAEIAKLRAENAQLRLEKAHSGPFGIKVSAKGAVSVYGMGRFPVTLYREQWAKVFAKQKDINAFIEAHSAELSVKGE